MRNKRRTIGRVSFAVTASLLASQGLLTTVIAASSSQLSNAQLTDTTDFTLPAGNLADTITALSIQTGIQIIVPSDLIKNEKNTALIGRYTAEAALNKLIENTQLSVGRSGNRALTLVKASSPSQAMGVQSNKDLEQIVVYGSYTNRDANSATGLNMSLRKTPQAITVMTNFRLEDQNLTEISDAIAQSVGLSYDGTPLGSDGSYFYSRGLAVSNYQINGVPRPAGIYGFEVTTADMVVYDRIEIVRGATGLMNGVGSPSASINLIRKRPTDQPQAYISAQTDSWGKHRLTLDIGGELNESGSIRGRIATAKEQGGSHIDRAELDKEAFYAVLEFDLTEQTLLTTGIEYQSIENTGASRSGLPLFFSNDGSRTNFDRSTNSGANWSILSNSSLSVFSNIQHTFDNDWRVSLDLEHAEPEYDDAFGYFWGTFDRDTGESDGSAYGAARWASDLEQNFVGLSLFGDFELLGNKHELVLGISHSTSKDEGPNYCTWWCWGDYRLQLDNVYKLFSTGDVIQPDFSPTGGFYGGKIIQNSAYGALRFKPLDNLAFVVGARITDWSEQEWTESAEGIVTNTPDNDEKNVTTPYFGLVFDITGNLSAYASFTQIFEPQNRYDLNDNRLDPLEGNNYEMGIKADVFDSLLSVSASIFRIEQDNFAVILPGLTSPSGNWVYRSEDGTTSKGFEIEVAGEIIPGWQVVGGISRATPEGQDGEPLLTDIATDSIKLFTSYEINKLTIGGSLRWQSDVYSTEDGPNFDQSYTQGSFTVIDLLVKYTVSEAFTVQLNFDNIFDKKYYAGFYSGTYGEPSNITASVKYNF
ncbi:MAG: TonB-dependent siderophore receptor [Paraglaciecola sp.]|uniref:TonB-dependent siderophore receptor n=1 Tax=Paraglaciecola sp. TaxID=1920173 RepID=UPI00329945C5